jgi:hypothetical protein
MHIVIPPWGEAGAAQGPEHEAVAQGAAVGEFTGGAAADQGNGSQGGLELPGHRFHRVGRGEESDHQGWCLDRGEALRKKGGHRFGDRPGRIGVAGTAAAHPAGAWTAGFPLDRWLWHRPRRGRDRSSQPRGSKPLQTMRG